MSDVTSQRSTQIICVLGMHRSGTSLITRVLNLLGVYLGPEEHLMKPNEFNPQGFWEHQSIVDLDDEILARLGGSWRDPPEFPVGWESSPEFADLRKRARALIQEDFRTATCWGWKDPRTCLTLPFWKQLLSPLRYVICLRNPTDVARSLAHHAYEAMPTEKAIDLWHWYIKAALEHSAGLPRIFVFYEDFMDNWRQDVRCLAQFVGIRDDEVTLSIFDAVRDVVAEELHHHRTSLLDVVDEARIPFPAKALYLALRYDVGLERRSGAESMFAQLQETLNVFSGYSFAARNEWLEYQRQLAELRERAGELDAMRQELALRDAALHDAQSKLKEQAAEIREHLARTEQQRLQLERETARAGELAKKLEGMQCEAEDLRRDLVARDMTVARLESEIVELRQRSHDDIHEQLDQFRDAITGQGARIVAALEGLQRRDTGGQAALAAPSGGLAANKVLDRQQYREMIERCRRLVASHVPANATVAVVSKGDPELLQLHGRKGWHFPQRNDGSYSGFHPKDSADAIKELDRVRANGAKFLVFPATAFWWLEHYTDLAKHLTDHARLVARDDQTGVIFGLQEDSVQAAPTSPASTLEYNQLVRQVCGLATSILPPDAKVLVVTKGDPNLLELGGCAASHFPQDAQGVYAGHHPADSATAIDHLEELRHRGAQFLVFPKSASWWFEHYTDFRRHLENKYRAVVRQRHVCTIFDLNGR